VVDRLLGFLVRGGGVVRAVELIGSTSTTSVDEVSRWKGPAAAGEKGRMKVRRKMREPRFCFQTRSDVDVLDDGYKWRKYGQKVVKNSLHPRYTQQCIYGDPKFLTLMPLSKHEFSPLLLWELSCFNLSISEIS